ncbi:Conserved protein containing a Zn-ribbon-like motif, possibly RNA-binding [Auraticoccus monumenti]|uniref:Conserved protein containing a Zn-ribbon-like motif, possibly RNA-binding n=1 Tax=Auraticoccus monumenti TaxID=675864 RepID=A0A1G7A0S0_9ACTN|nr:Conserved protein containing a Zn-ribbon-like motif, possibly RNA-binding [Auraticoccus monumenti]
MRAFVNSVDLETGVDRLADPTSWREWADQHDIDVPASEADLGSARRLRESLRAALLANHDRAPLPDQTVTALDETARRSRLTARFTADGVHLEPGGQGVDAVLGRVVAVVAAAIQDGTWSRLKACANDTCQWAFYDTSRSRTGQWCSMRICGNRAKQSRWRQQNGAH